MSSQQDIEGMVRKRFTVKEVFALPEGELEFQVDYGRTSKESFLALKSELEPLGYGPILSGEEDGAVLTLKKLEPPEARLPRLPVFLVFFTLASVVIFGILQVQVYGVLIPGMSPYLVFFGFCLPVTLAMGAHEVCQRYAGRGGGGHASSYLIPGIPYITSFLPALGFVSVQREPALNRDKLFDTVVAGPLAILVISVLLYAVGDLTAVQSSIPFVGSSAVNNTVTINPNLIQVSLQSLLPRTAAPGYLLMSPLADGATVGFILAFMAFLPMATYDGGLLSNIAWGARSSKVASYLSVLVLLVFDTPNYWALAVVVLLIAGRPFQLKLSDEISPLSRRRRWVFLLTLVIAFLCLPIPQNLATFPLP